jgi:hypothetical protein
MILEGRDLGGLEVPVVSSVSASNVCNSPASSLRVGGGRRTIAASQGAASAGQAS